MLEIGNRDAKRAAAMYQQRKRILHEPVNASRVKRFRRAIMVIGRCISEKAKYSSMVAKLLLSTKFFLPHLGCPAGYAWDIYCSLPVASIFCHLVPRSLLSTEYRVHTPLQRPCSITCRTVYDDVLFHNEYYARPPRH